MHSFYPFIRTLDPGTYHWCSCGGTKTQPFCDGSHEGTDFRPLEFTVTERERFSLCNCQLTRKPPFCDNAHLKV